MAMIDEVSFNRSGIPLKKKSLTIVGMSA